MSRKKTREADLPVIDSGDDGAKPIDDSLHDHPRELWTPIPPQVPLLLFSGGLDSTYMLYEALRDSPVDTLYIPGVVEPAKEEAEFEARMKIYAWLDTHAKHKVRNRITAEGFELGDHRLLAMAQPLAWIFGALKKVNYQNTQNSKWGT